MKDASAQMEQVTQGIIQACDEVNVNCCKSVDALVEATSAMSKGYEEFSRKLGSLMQESVSRAMNAGKTMMAAKSIKEVGDLQTEFAKGLFDQWLQGTGRLTEISARITQEAFQPVARHANDTMSKVAERAQQGRAA